MSQCAIDEFGEDTQVLCPLCGYGLCEKITETPEVDVRIGSRQFCVGVDTAASLILKLERQTEASR